MRYLADTFARGVAPSVSDAVRKASVAKTQQRLSRLAESFLDPEAARTRAAEIKDEVLADLENLLTAFAGRAGASGITIHHAKTPEDARQIILEICRANPGPVVKGKSMATEEIHLNQALEEAGIEVTETDLGEYVIQIDHDVPSHIVTPIIHKDRFQVARSFQREGLGEYTEDPEQLAGQARKHLRKRFREAAVGISGVNFAVVDTGQLVIVENEGNNRLSTTAPRVHIAVMGIEKLIPRATDLPLFLKLLAGSATGQAITTYVHHVSGPGDDGPAEIHLVLLDAGRRDILNSRYRAILRCIRCGACLNVCPVYRQISGHGYGHVYPGPLGAVLAPLLDPKSNALRQIPKASTLCGACEEVCPVKIPIPDMLLHLRDATGEKNSWAPFAMAATDPRKWAMGRAGVIMAPAIGWSEFRDGPFKEGRAFRSWFESRTDKAPRLPLKSGSTGRADSETATDKLQADLVERFRENLESLGGKLVLADRFEDGLREIAFDPAQAIGDSGFGFDPKVEVWEAEFGLTEADFGVAETGTIIIGSGEGRSRMHSLAPPISIILLRRDRLLMTLEEAMGRQGEGNGVWITGPSRTADIEGVLVRGVHGPGELIVILVP